MLYLWFTMSLVGNAKSVARSVLTFLLVLNTNSSFSQPTGFPYTHFKHYSIENGLSNKQVFFTLQDKNGFMWFLTFTGLDRFDGISFKSYHYQKDDNNSLLPGWFSDFIQAPNGIMWICDGEAGFYSFNPVTEKFKHFVHDVADVNSLSSDWCYNVCVDRNDNLWISTNKALDMFNPVTEKFTHFRHVDGDSTTISTSYVQSICFDENNILWIATSDPGVDCFDPTTGKVIAHYNYGSKNKLITDVNSPSYSINKGRNGNMLISSIDNGLFIYNTRDKSEKHFLHDDKKNSISCNNILKSYEEASGNLWISSGCIPIDFYNKSTSTFQHLNFEQTILSDLGSTQQVFEDKNNSLWMITENGIYQFETRSKKIQVYKNDSEKINSISDDFVNTIFRDSRNQLWIGAATADILDDATNTFKHFKIIEDGKNLLSAGIMHFYEDKEKRLWFSTYSGVGWYDPNTKKHRWYSYNMNDSISLSAQSVTGIIQDRKGRYWCTTWGGGLNLFSPETGIFKSFKVHNGSNSINSNFVGNLMEDSRGIIYMGSWNGGLIAFNPDDETFKFYRHDPKDSTSLSCDVGGHYCETKSGEQEIIWLTTIGGGINALNPITGKFRSFTSNDGLCNDYTVCITEDDNGNLWIGTYNGISCFTPPKNPFEYTNDFRFRNYSVSDGLPSNHINLSATYKDANGKIYFGSENGLFSFFPDELKDNDFIPPVYITQFDLFNKVILQNDESKILSKPIEQTKEIQLNYDQDKIAFTFASLNYFHPEKNKYAYKLEGYDKEWTFTDANNRNAFYTNLNAGEYIFKVRGSNNDGIWNPNETIINLTITPPYWETFWFRALIALIITSIAYLIYRFRVNQILKLQSIRNKIAHDLHDDIGSTLNSISVFSQVAQQEPEKQKAALEMIGESSRTVIEAMSDIVWAINPSHDSFEEIILRMRSFSYNLLRAKNIEQVFRADESLNNLKLSIENRRNFYLFFKEAINNLIKHSEATYAEFHLTGENNYVVLTIQDNGNGYDTTKEYNGNGILSMRKRANEMKAFLKIESTLGKGTYIYLKLKTQSFL